MIVKTWTWHDEAATEAFARRLAAQWQRDPASAHVLVLLHGDLGAGKTTLVRHLLRALGVQGRIKSPTFAVVEPYSVPGMAIWHFDFYRFTDPREWEDSGFRDLFASQGVKLVEWPEKAAGVLPVADWEVYLTAADDGVRQMRIEAATAAGMALLEAV